MVTETEASKILVDATADQGTRAENVLPSAYRLAIKQSGNGALVLQGCYHWWKRHEHGQEWRDIPTEMLP